MKVAGPMITYNPRPVFELLANALIEAIKARDWDKVEEIHEQVKKLTLE